MYSENFGVTFASDANRVVDSLVAAPKSENWQVVTPEPSAGRRASAFDAQPVVEPTVEVPSSPDAAVSEPTVTASTEVQKNKRIAELNDSANVAAVFCLINAVALIGLGQGPIGIRLLSCAIWVCIAVGIFLMSRIAAVIGLLLIAVNVGAFAFVLYNYSRPIELDPKGMYMVIVFYFLWTKAVYTAIVGSFEYHRTLSSNSGGHA